MGPICEGLGDPVPHTVGPCFCAAILYSKLEYGLSFIGWQIGGVLQEAMATVREAGDSAKGPEPLVEVAVEPSAEEGATAKKSKKRKVAEAQAVQAQAAEAANGAPGAYFSIKQYILCNDSNVGS